MLPRFREHGVEPECVADSTLESCSGARQSLRRRRVMRGRDRRDRIRRSVSAGHVRAEDPEGEEFGSDLDVRFADVSLDEAAERASFPMFEIPRLPEGSWRAIVRYLPSRERPLTQQTVSISYMREDAREHIQLHQTAADARPDPWPPGVVRRVSARGDASCGEFERARARDVARTRDVASACLDLALLRESSALPSGSITEPTRRRLSWKSAARASPRAPGA
jgi:hypothetical protein